MERVKAMIKNIRECRAKELCPGDMVVFSKNLSKQKDFGCVISVRLNENDPNTIKLVILGLRKNGLFTIKRPLDYVMSYNEVYRV